MLSHTVKDSVVTIRIQIKLRNKLRGSPSLSNKVNRKSTGGRIQDFHLAFSNVESSTSSILPNRNESHAGILFFEFTYASRDSPYNPRRSLYSLMKALLFLLNSVSYGLK